MAKFEPGKTVKTREPLIEVDAGLPVGRHRFQLVVVTETNQSSPPDVVTVEVVPDTLRPRLGADATPVVLRDPDPGLTPLHPAPLRTRTRRR